MSQSEPPPAGGRRTRSTIVVAFLVVGAVLPGVLGCSSSGAAPSSSATSPFTAEPIAQPPRDSPHRELQRELVEADGGVPDGTTVFDDDVPAVTHLDPALLRALREAGTDAAGDGIELQVNSGWRTPAYQEHLLDEAVSRYGSRPEAARWVATPDTSPHVSGDAVDIGPDEAAAWLSEHGSDYGLCPIYRNEPWHYELRTDAVNRGCPSRFADPTHDPRMQETR